ncbi:MAG: hypothetical protein K6T66_01650 [Peptococcaceae bacterium]|nr:hypothetical protein [Peptococcaceae bacterium]
MRDEYLGRALSWIASGPCAVIEEGARMILDFALAVIHLRAGDAGAAPALCEGSPVDKKAYLVDEGQCPEEEKIIAGMAGVGIQLIPVSSGDLISIPEGQRASNTVLVRGVRSGRISALFGLAAGGFDVCASLPLGLLACHDLRGVFERLLTDCYGGRLTDFSEFAPTGRK